MRPLAVKNHWLRLESPAGAPPPQLERPLSLSLVLSIIVRRRRSVCRGYTNKDNLERQQSITAALKVTAAPSAASARHRRAPPLPFFSFLFNLFLLRETKGRRLFPLSRVCVVTRRKERKKKSMVQRQQRSPFPGKNSPIVGGVSFFSPFLSLFPLWRANEWRKAAIGRLSLADAPCWAQLPARRNVTSLCGAGVTARTVLLPP